MQAGPNPPQTVVVQQNVATTPFAGGQYVVVQQQVPSSAPTFIGILTALWGVGGIIFGIISLLAMSMMLDPNSELFIPELEEHSNTIMLQGILGTLLSVGYIIGGILTAQRKKLGIHITWATIAVLTGLNIGFEILYPELSSLGGTESLGVAFSLIVYSVCGGICGLLAAIPLFVNGSQMTD